MRFTRQEARERITEYERDHVNTFCDPTVEKYEACKTALGVTSYIARSTLEDLDLAEARVRYLEERVAELEAAEDPHVITTLEIGPDGTGSITLPLEPQE
jgi:hypothetical protein